MPFQAVPNAAEVVIEGTIDNQNIFNTFQFTHASGWGEDELGELAHACALEWSTGMLPLMSANYHFVQAVARDLRTPIALLATDTSGAGPGARATGLVPNNVALSVKRASAFTGRGARGRVFIPVTDLSNMVGPNEVTSAFATAVLGVLNTLMSAAETVDWNAVIVSRSGPGTTTTEAVVYTLVEWVVVNLVVDSMRRRLPGRGS